MMGELLHLESVIAGYGQNLILKGVDLAVAQGTVMCLIGPNGAGKSTVLKCVSGLLPFRKGDISFDGEPLARLSPKSRLQRGIVHVPQDRSLFPGMTVWENVVIGGHILTDRALLHRRVDEVVERFPLVGRRRHAHAGSLSGGEQKIVEIARSMILDPRLILLDEPSIGLDPKARRVVFDAIVGLAAEGRTVLLVEQNARSGLAVAHRGAVLEGGVVRLEGTGADLLTDPEVARLYLGAAPPAALLQSCS
jgi:branched-chain amino acid transport system ATP-binding protein